MEILEARPSDGLRLATFFLDNPLGVGTDFLLDRRPDFNALLHQRGHFRTFYAVEGDRLLGTVTALWNERRDGEARVRVGEYVDLRVTSSARGGRAVRRLLGAALDALRAADVQWMCALVGDQNRAARTLVEGKAGLPKLHPLARWVSVHLVALRGPRPSGRRVTVREADESDSGLIHDAVRRAWSTFRLVPEPPLDWPDPDGRHRGWIATGHDGTPTGGLVVWDGYDVRRVRVVRYTGVDRLLRLGTRVLERVGLASALPPPGGAIRMWASRAFWNEARSPPVTRALISTALRQAAASGVSIVQLNAPEGDSRLRQLPPYPRSSYRSTLYGARLDEVEGGADDAGGEAAFFADLARV